MSAPSSCAMKCRIVLATIGIILGISAFCSFGFVFKNWNCALWGLTSGIVAIVALAIHIQHIRGYWKHNVDNLRFFMLLGCVVQLAGVCGFVVYLTLGITEQQGLVIRGNGYYLALVWCFMTWKWGFLLFFYSRSYKRLHEECYSLLGYQEEQ